MTTEGSRRLGVHASHKTRFSDSSVYDEVCTLCGATDELGSFGELSKPCPAASSQVDDRHEAQAAPEQNALMLELAAQLESKVKRFDAYSIMMSTDGNPLHPSPTGTFVLYDDYVAAIAALCDTEAGK